MNTRNKRKARPPVPKVIRVPADFFAESPFEDEERKLQNLTSVETRLRDYLRHTGIRRKPPGVPWPSMTEYAAMTAEEKEKWCTWSHQGQIDSYLQRILAKEEARIVFNLKPKTRRSLTPKANRDRRMFYEVLRLVERYGVPRAEAERAVADAFHLDVSAVIRATKGWGWPKKGGDPSEPERHERQRILDEYEHRLREGGYLK